MPIVPIGRCVSQLHRSTPTATPESLCSLSRNDRNWHNNSVYDVNSISSFYIEYISFYPRDAMLARVLAMALCLSVSVSCPSQVGVLSKLVDGSSWFLARRLFFDQSVKGINVKKT